MNRFVKNASQKQAILLFFISLILVGFGQPAWNSAFSLMAAAFGYALFFSFLCKLQSPKNRFLTAFLWFTGVQLIQLSWLVSHPYLYIYFVYAGLSAWLGVQFGIIGWLADSRRLTSYRWILGLSGLWVLLEWSRLFVLSGLSFNPIGLALTAHLYPMQLGSLMGVYGLSFWVFMVNLIAVKGYLENFKWKTAAVWFVLAVFPYLYGWGHVAWHDSRNKTNESLTAVLVQPAFPAEEFLKITDRNQFLTLTIHEWRQILKILARQKGEKADLILMPENMLPFGTYSFVYPLGMVKKAFYEILGQESLKALPALESPLAVQQETDQGRGWMVNNAYWVQALANFFQSEIVAGLEDAEETEEGKVNYYSSALHFFPRKPSDEFSSSRYEKRVLVPMGEYIPFSFLSALAQEYGLMGSFTHGTEAKVFEGKTKMGVSICYEETYGHLMRENRQKGAEILLNLTNDIWYPNSRLIFQHFDHARMRTVENGIPLLRACNTGLTAGLDSLGRIVAQLGDPKKDHIESLSDSIRVKVPLYSYHTWYSVYGDWLAVGFSLFALGACFYRLH